MTSGHYKHRLRLSAEKDEERMKLYRQGLTDTEIGKRVGVRPDCIFHWRKHRHLPRVKGLQKLRLEDLFERGYTDDEIAAKLGMKRPTVGRWRRGLGLLRSKPRVELPLPDSVKRLLDKFGGDDMPDIPIGRPVP